MPPGAAFTRSGLFGLGERGSRGLDGVDPVVLGAAGTLVVLDLNDVFTASAKTVTKPAAKLPVPSNAQTRRPGAQRTAQASIRR